MLVVETIGRIRREHFVKGKSIKEIVRELRVSRNTVRKVLRSGATCFEYAGEPSVFTSHSVATLGAEQKRAAPQGAAYSSLRLSKTQAIRAVLLARATIVRLKPRRATSAFSQVDRRSSRLADRLTMARAPWISWRLR